MNRTISLSFGLRATKDLSSQVTTILSRECDIGNDEYFTHHEAVICWQLGLNDEYIIYSLLQGNRAMVDVYGVCGNMYALQYVPSEPFLGYFPSLLDGRSWHFRGRLAIAMLNLVEALNDTPYGTLHLCDFQEPNFGVVCKVKELYS